MMMEEVASDENLIRAFAEVARNRGAPGPDGRSIDELREHLAELIPALRRHLRDGTYRPGMIRRVWIPKTGGGERGLGIPDVVDRWVQQAVLRVLSPPLHLICFQTFGRGRISAFANTAEKPER